MGRDFQMCNVRIKISGIVVTECHKNDIMEP